MDEDQLESIDLYPSVVIERTIIRLGYTLLEALQNATRLDEVQLLIDSIGEYTLMVSTYGSKTGRMPESLGVSLNEAALIKHQALEQDLSPSDTYFQFAEQVAPALQKTEQWLKSHPTETLN